MHDVAGLVAKMRGPVLMARENGQTIPYYAVANNGPFCRTTQSGARHLWVGPRLWVSPYGALRGEFSYRNGVM